MAPPSPPTTLTYLTAGGDAPPPLTAANAHLLNQLVEHAAWVKQLRSSGMFDILWGGLMVGLGMLMLGFFVSRGPALTPFRLAPIGIAVGWSAMGAILVASGVWMYLRPNVIAMAIDASVLLMLCGVNVVLNVRTFMAGGMPRLMDAVVLLVLLITTVNRFRQLRRFKEVAQTPLTPQTAKWLRETQREISRAKPGADPRLVSFTAMAWRPLSFKGRLLDELAVGLVNGKLRFLTREQFRVSLITPGPKWAKAGLTVGDRTMTAQVPALDMARLLAWQESPSTPEANLTTTAPLPGNA